MTERIEKGSTLRIDGEPRTVTGVSFRHDEGAAHGFAVVYLDHPKHPGQPCSAHRLPLGFIRDPHRWQSVTTGGHRYSARELKRPPRVVPLEELPAVELMGACMDLDAVESPERAVIHALWRGLIRVKKAEPWRDLFECYRSLERAQERAQ